MADWQSKLDLKEVWESEDPKLISAEIAKQLRALDLSFLDGAKIVSGVRTGLNFVNVDVVKTMATELADEFAELSEQENPDAEDFDDVMNSLYNWADHRIAGPGRKRLCWVATVV